MLLKNFRNYRFLPLCTLFALLLSSACNDDEPNNDPPRGGVLTGQTEKVGIVSAIINGQYDADTYTDPDSIYIGIAYSTQADLFSSFDFALAEILNGNQLQATLTRLKPDQDYYYTTCVWANDSILAIGQIRTFHTQDLPAIAQATPATDIYLSQATIGYSYPIVQQPSLPADLKQLELYLLYHTDSLKAVDFNQANKIYSFETTGTSEAQYAQLSNLLSGQTYYYCVCTHLAANWYYSEVKHLTTQSMLQYLDLDTTAISYEAANISFQSHLAQLYPDYSRTYTLYYGTDPNLEEAHEERLNYYNTDSATFHLEPLQPGQTYYYQFQLELEQHNMVSHVRSAILQFTTPAYPEPVQSGYVDLGLASGTLWAACNLGADAPQQIGTLYAWGETQPKDTYTEDNYQHISRAEGGWPITYHSIGNEISGSLYDAATQQADADQLPTAQQTAELLQSCYQKVQCRDGVYGILFIGPNHQAIFVPIGTQQYSNRPVFWTGTAEDYFDACCLWYDGSLGKTARYEGLPVRPVRA